MVNLTDSGRFVFRMYMPHAGSVELLGSFCSWKPERSEGAIELERDPEGWWTARLNLPEGDHEFCYLVDGRTWMPDYAAGGVRRSSTGRWVSLLSVPPGHETESRPIGSLAEPRIGREGVRDEEREYVHA
jgi:1,4-alpha-glucan branching enzyme